MNGFNNLIPGFKNPSVMKHDFSRSPSVNIRRSNFNMSHKHATTIDAGYLVPILIDEIHPGDTVNLRKLEITARITTLLKPIVDNLHIDTFFFYCPMRLLWENTHRFFGERDPDPDSSIDYQIPYIAAKTSTGYDENSIFDYLGLPPGVPDFEHNALPLRMYNLIWNSWFRHQDLQDSVTENKDDGPDLYTDYELLRRNKRFDYFTSALPNPQKGDAIELPLGQTAPVIGTGNALGIYDGTYEAGTMLDTLATGEVILSDAASGAAVGGTPSTNLTNMTNASVIGVTDDPDLSGLIADLSTATAANINDFREALALQQLLEMDARGGTRYEEMIFQHFGVISPDQRLHRPEYLSGSSRPFAVVPVPQQHHNPAIDVYLGDLGATAFNNSRGSGFVKSFTEHGYIMGLINVRADLTYQKGIRKLWSRETRFDFYYPVLAFLGEQAIYGKELYVNDPTVDTGSTGTPDNDKVFGYIPRWDELRSFPSEISGTFRSDHSESLDVYHLSEDFAALPTLNSDFMESEPPIDRIVKVTDPVEPQILLDCYFDMVYTRPMPAHSIPGLGNHF